MVAQLLRRNFISSLVNVPSRGSSTRLARVNHNVLLSIQSNELEEIHIAPDDSVIVRRFAVGVLSVGHGVPLRNGA